MLRAARSISSEPCAAKFGDADRHALAAQHVGHAGDCGSHHLCIRMGVAADFVLAAIKLAAQRRTLQQNVFQTEAEAFLGNVPG